MPTPSAETEALLIYLRDWFRDHPAPLEHGFTGLGRDGETVFAARDVTQPEPTLAQDVDALTEFASRTLKPSAYSEYVDRFEQQSAARPALFLHAPVSSSRETQALPPLVPDRPGQWLRYDTDAGEELKCVVWEHSSFGLLWNWPGNGAGGPWGVGLMPELWRGPAPTDPAQAYRSLSDEAKALMWEIINGDLARVGAHKATGSDAEREAIAAKCVVSDGVHVWVAQECAHRVTGPRGPAPANPTREYTAAPAPMAFKHLEAAATLRAYFDSDASASEFEAIDVLLEGCARANDRPRINVNDEIRKMLNASPSLAMLTQSVVGASGTHPQGFWAEGHIVEVVGALKDDPRMTLVRSHGYTDIVATRLLKPLEPGTGSTWDDSPIVATDAATAARIRDAFTSPKPATLHSQGQDALASRQRDRLDRIRDASTDELAALSRVYLGTCYKSAPVQDMARRYRLMCAELDASPEPGGVERVADGHTLTITSRVKGTSGAIGTPADLLARGAVQDMGAEQSTSRASNELAALQKATGCDNDLTAQTIALRVWKAVHGIEYPTTTPSLRTVALEAATLLRTSRREVEELRAKTASSTPDAVRALAAIYCTLAPGCPADEDGSGEWSIDDVVEAAKACAGDWLAVCKLLGFDEALAKPAVMDEIDKLQRNHARLADRELQASHVQICEALGIHEDSDAQSIAVLITAHSVRWRRVCKAFGLHTKVDSSAITDRVYRLKSDIAAANETLAAYCPDCDPARSSLSSTVSLLVSDVLDPAQVERERKREQLTQSNILANARTAYVNANWRDRVYIEGCEDRTEQHAREIVGKVFDRALAAKAKA